MSPELTPELTPEFLADYETPQALRISPSGLQVAYALRSFWVRKHKQENVTASLWIADVGKENSARRLTLGKSNDSNPQFSPDGKSITFLSDRADPGKGNALYVMPIASAGEGLPLTDTTNEKGIGDYRWSPDGKKVAFTSPDEKSEDKKKREEEKDDAKVWGKDWDFNRLRVLDVSSQEVNTVFEENAHVSSFDWSPDSKRIAFQEWKTPELDCYFNGGKIKVLDVASKTTTQLVEVTGEFSSLIWRGDALYWIGQSDGEGSQKGRSVWGMEVDWKGSKPENVAYGKSDCAQDIKRCGDEVIVYVQDGLLDQLKVLDAEAIHEEEIDISRAWDVAFDNGKVTVAMVKALDTALPLEVFSIVDGKQCQLSNHTEKLAEFKLAKTSLLYCRAHDGTPLDGTLSIPSRLSKKKDPHATVVLIHGGPYSRINSGSDMLLLFCEWFLSLGYVVLQPNYRGGSGHGEKFARAVLGDASASYSDVIDLLSKAILDGVVNKDKVAIAGWSQGGYMSYLAPTRDSTFHFAAAIAGAGVSDWDTMALTSDVPTYEARLTGSAPWMTKVSKTHGRKGSPLYHMQDINTPYLILHGEKDQRVPIEQAIGFHRGLRARGKECEMVIYPREGHGFPMPFERLHYIHMLNKMKDFLEKHLR